VLKIILVLGARQQVVLTRMSKIRYKINEDRRHTTDEISEATGVSWSSCQWILTVGLNMRCIATKFVPHLLTQDQK
jgi:response regulator of citrate/malate metabolism